MMMTFLPRPSFIAEIPISQSIPTKSPLLPSFPREITISSQIFLVKSLFFHGFPSFFLGIFPSFTQTRRQCLPGLRRVGFRGGHSGPTANPRCSLHQGGWGFHRTMGGFPWDFRGLLVRCNLIYIIIGYS